MRNNRLIAAAAGVAFASTALVGCSGDDLDKAASDAADAAKEKGSEMASDAASKAGDAASDAASDAKSKAGDAAGEGQADGEGGDAAAAGGSGDVSVDLGDFADDAGAKTVGEFFTLRFEAANGSGDVSTLESITTAQRYQGVQNYVENASPSSFAMKVVGVEGDSVDVCIGGEAQRARTIELVDGKVDKNLAGEHTC